MGAAFCKYILISNLKEIFMYPEAPPTSIKTLYRWCHHHLDGVPTRTRHIPNSTEQLSSSSTLHIYRRRGFLSAPRNLAHITFFVLGNRRTSHLHSLYRHKMQRTAYLCQAEAPAFFLVTVCWEPSRCWLRVHSLPIRIRGCDQFRTAILAHLRFKRIVSCWFCNRRMRLKTRVYGTHSMESIDYLDTQHLDTNLGEYLHFESCHENSVHKAIPIGECMRYAFTRIVQN